MKVTLNEKSFTNVVSIELKKGKNYCRIGRDTKKTFFNLKVGAEFDLYLYR